MYIKIKPNFFNDATSLFMDEECKQYLSICERTFSATSINALLSFIHEQFKKLPIIQTLDESEYRKIESELLLYAINSLTCYNRIPLYGVNNLLNYANFTDESIAYKNKKSFDPFTKKYALHNTTKIMIPKQIILDDKTRIPYNLIHETGYLNASSPLYEYLDNHLISRESPSYQIELSVIAENNSILDDFSDSNTAKQTAQSQERTMGQRPNRLTQNNKYIFSRDSSYFINALAKIITDKTTIPYTEEAKSGISLKSINTIFDKMFNAYQDVSLQEHENKLEKDLFLYNLEKIFMPSLTHRIFDMNRTYFKELNKPDLSDFTNVLQFCFSLKELPLNALQLLFLKNTSVVEIAKQNTDTTSPESYTSQILSATCFIKAFICALVWQMKNVENLSTAIDILKQTYLSHQERHTVKQEWSIFEDQNKQYEISLNKKNSARKGRSYDIRLKHVDSVFNEYFDFYILYSLFSTDALEFNTVLCELSPHGVLNHYATYKLSSKR